MLWLCDIIHQKKDVGTLSKEISKKKIIFSKFIDYVCQKLKAPCPYI